MSNRHYPYLSSKKRLKSTKCEKCGVQGLGYELEWQVSWFRGDDEYQKLCDSHTNELMKNHKKAEDQREAREAKAYRKEAQKEQRIKNQLEEKYEVKYLTPYQWRINGVLDVYPTNGKYHLLKENKRGYYSNIFTLLDEKLRKTL